MAQPIVIGYHLIWTAYGWWLPNDPRGSTSKFVHSDVIFELGNLHKGRKIVQPSRAELLSFYKDAALKLKFSLLDFDDRAITVIANAVQDVIVEQKYTCYAAAIMPDHVHLLIRKHRDSAVEMIESFQDRSRKFLRDSRAREMDHPVWGGPGWKVFLDHPDDIRRTIPYIEQNPVKLGRAVQCWSFVTAYDGWPLHPGHSPNSPYARRLKDHDGSEGHT